MDFVYKKLAQFAVRGALPPRRSESPGCAADNKPSCVLHLLGLFIGSRGFSSEQRPEFWVLQYYEIIQNFLYTQISSWISGTVAHFKQKFRNLILANSSKNKKCTYYLYSKILNSRNASLLVKKKTFSSRLFNRVHGK